MAAVQTGSELFEQRWSTYDRILAGNHLFHRELYAELRKYLRATFTEPIEVLDLGCGDCHYLAEQLVVDGEVCLIASFTGVDLAAGALEAARENIRKALRQGTPTHFANSDIVKFVADSPQRFDLAFASYSVHHLTLEQKDQLVQHLAKALKPGGVYFQADWKFLPQEGKDDISRHARECDLPETLDTWRSLAYKHGFSSCTILDTHPHPDTGFCLVMQK
ncbi:hypothetical protein WJX74_004405 [Apatococcus lobatus]|uniref:Methyltransferase domain-containing protein n=1 Tax=Apatococcus lobatus TaxID=904363 RepID=A0AAW1QHQ7_9CHLO